MRVSILRFAKAKMPQETELDDIVRIMRSSQKLRGLCEEYKKLADEDNKNEKKRIKQTEIPAFIPSASLYGGKGHQHILGLTNLCYLDIDGISDDQIDGAFLLLRQDEHVVLASRSMSGKGIHILIKYGFVEMEQPWIATMGINKMVKTYKAVFRTISHHYSKSLHLPIDKSGRNVVQSCNISYDKELYYNPKALPHLLSYNQLNSKK